MEELYQPFCGKMVTADLLKAIRKDTPMLTGAVARAFAEIFFKNGHCSSTHRTELPDRRDDSQICGESTGT